MESSVLKKVSPSKRDVIQRLVSSVGQYVPQQSRLKPLEPWSPIPKTLIACDGSYKIFDYTLGQYTFKAYENAPAVKLNIQKDQSKMKVDTTGQWVWQAELLLAHQILKNRNQDKFASVLELGAGSSGYAALAAFLAYQPERVLITDGNKDNLATLEKTISGNGWKDKGIQVQQLVWGNTRVKDKYQLILAADCLLFDKHHDSLIQTLKQAMELNSLVLMVCPSRGKSMERFIQKCSAQGLAHSVTPVQKNEAERQSQLQQLQKTKSYSRLDKGKENEKKLFDEDRHLFFIIQLRLA